MNSKFPIMFMAIFLFFCTIECKTGLVYHGVSWAQEGDDSGWEEEGDKIDGYYNIFFKTDDLIKKLGAFFLLISVSYISFWFLFSSLIKKNKSPSKIFTVCFSLFMLAFYLLAFLCFSEYVLIQKYDDQTSYLSQLNWTFVLIALLVWIPVSLGMTYLLKGKS